MAFEKIIRSVHAVAILLVLISSKSDGREFRCYSRLTDCQLSEVVLETESAIADARFISIPRSLTVETGRIPFVTKSLFNKWSDVNDITLNAISVRSLFLHPRLMHVTAKHNAIDTLLFDSNSTEYGLRTLQLSYNALTELPSSLDRLVQLRVLELDHNQLTTVDMTTLGKLSELRMLSLAHNQLTVLAPERATLRMLKLRTLSLAGNQLVTLDVQSWEMDSLVELNLTANSLNWLDGQLGQFPVLKKVELARNHWSCDWFVVQHLYPEPNLESLPFTLDADEPGQCEHGSMMRIGQHCCATTKLPGGSIDPYEDKWSEIGELERKIQKLNRTIHEGSTERKQLLESKYTDLSQRLEQLLEKHRTVDEALQKLETKVSTISEDELATLERELNGKMDAIRLSVEEKWNNTLLNRTEDGTRSAGNWTLQATTALETEISSLRSQLESSMRQFNLYTEKAYRQKAMLDRQSTDIDAVQGKVENVLQLHNTLQDRIKQVLEPKVDVVLGFLGDITDDSDEAKYRS
uniref:Putative membrane glycoprotein lig-1 membrane glycoprotein lig-1 n=1 Tax=Anopheles triannulatus TaxID=58253 RepID=A0A2M4AR79_9DIPT